MNLLEKLEEKFPDDKEIEKLIERCDQKTSNVNIKKNIQLQKKYYKTGNNYYTKKEYKKALINFKKALRYSSGNKKILQKIKSCKLKIKQKNNSKIGPMEIKSHYQKGLKFYSMGQYEKAIMEWEKVLELASRDNQVLS